MVSEPVASVVVFMLAVPPSNCTDPSDFVPDLNCTEPVGVPEPLGVMVTVKATDCPKVDGFTDEVIDAVVVALVTTCDIAGDVLPAFVASPE